MILSILLLSLVFVHKNNANHSQIEHVLDCFSYKKTDLKEARKAKGGLLDGLIRRLLLLPLMLFLKIKPDFILFLFVPRQKKQHVAFYLRRKSY